jgi:phospholipid/cholesterol/gamma-HCH transport system ATP-binding protein
MTVRENLEFPLRRNFEMSEEEINERVYSVLEAVSLEEAIDKMPSELSGGMRKRIGLARSIITKPKLMLYDEPTTGLDPITAKEISVLINDLQHAYKMTSIVVTHDLLCAKIIADRAIVLNDGKIVKEGSITELVSSSDPLLRNFFSDEVIENNPNLFGTEGR